MTPELAFVIQGRSTSRPPPLRALGQLLVRSARKRDLPVKVLRLTMVFAPDGSALAPVIRWEPKVSRFSINIETRCDAKDTEDVVACMHRMFEELDATLRAAMAKLVKKPGFDAAGWCAALDDARAALPATADAFDELDKELDAEQDQASRLAAGPGGPLKRFRGLSLFVHAEMSDPLAARILEGAVLDGGTRVSSAGPALRVLVQELDGVLKRLDLRLPGYDYINVCPSTVLAEGETVVRVLMRGDRQRYVTIGTQADRLRAVCRGDAREEGIALLRRALLALVDAGIDPAIVEEACEAVLRGDGALPVVTRRS